MFALVADVESYPRRFNWCESAQVVERQDSEVRAALSVRVLGVAVSFVTRNTESPPHTIVLQLDQGPFRDLQGAWQFKPIGVGGCRVSLDLRFEMTRGLVASAAAAAFAHVADRMVDDFAKAAKDAYR